MSTINLYNSYNNKLRKLSINDSDTFRKSFVDAVNLAYAEFNDQVFQNQTLEYIESFDDVIDERLISFGTLTYDAGAGESLPATGDREFWSSEWDLERLSDTNGITDTLTDDAAATIVLSILNGVFSIATSSNNIDATATLPDTDVIRVKFTSSSTGNALTVDGTAVALTYTNGDEDTTQPIATLSTRIISGVSGYTLNRTAFSSPATKLFEFLLNEGTGTALTDEIEGYGATLSASPVWETVYIAPSSSLDSQYMSPFSQAIDFHLQDGGQWALEPEESRERQWYGRGIKQARNIYQQNSTYTNPLGI